MQPLTGITVVALERAIAAPLATRQLADLGARVIKIERPGSGDFARHYDTRARGLSSHFVWTNRNKLSLTLNLQHQSARALLHRLVLEQADVLVQNLAPGAAARLGLGAAALRAQRPELIVCDISGYGGDGPYRDRKAYDLLIQSEAGLLSVTGTPDAPAKAGAPVADIAAGMQAYAGVLAALLQRQRTGEGQHLDVSMLESLADWMGYPMYYTLDGAEPPPRAGAEHATIAPYGPFATADGSTLMLAVQNEREWLAFCTTVLQQPALADDPRFAGNARRVAAREALHACIDAVLGTLDRASLQQRLDDAHIAHAQVNTLADLWAHPQLQARRRWRNVPTPAGPVPALLPVGLPSRTEADDVRMQAVPALGADTVTLLQSLGVSDDAIESLRAEGAI